MDDAQPPISQPHDGTTLGTPVHPSYTEARSITDAERALSDMMEQRANLDKRILETSMVINASRLINRLPVELLVAIFRYVRGYLPKHQYSAPYPAYVVRNRPWYPMIAVCRHWHSVVCATPMLWRLLCILPETRIEHMELVLSRSKELPIEVDIYSIRRVALFTDVLLDYRARIASFHVQDVPRSQAPRIYELVQAIMPNLRTLNMWFNPLLADPMSDEDEEEDAIPMEEEEVFMLELSLGCYPQLRELSLRGVGLQGPLPWGSHGPSPPNLTHLELRDSTSPDCNIAEFVWFLRDCRHLQSLIIVRFRPLDEDFDTFAALDALEPLPVVALAPTLQHLMLEDIDMYVARLLSGLIVPASADISLTKLITMRDRDELRSASELVEEGFLTVLPEDRSGLPLFNHITGVRICISEYSAHLIAHAGERRMSVTITVDPASVVTLNPDMQSDVEELAAANDSITELTVMNIGDLRIWSSDLAGFLSSLPQLKTLSVLSVFPPPSEGLTSLEDELMETLGQPSISNACSALEELNFNCLTPAGEEGLIANLETLLRRRNSQGMRLRRLRIELAGRGHSVNLSDEARTAREARFLDTLRPLVDVVECAHDTLID
ncbi:hypothetical protein C8T65DRAFT_835866 [Cerioporus squamosus]|nr:hypothetical protein C8T65DRAFT_835866 [Cerioporus squamosus]